MKKSLLFLLAVLCAGCVVHTDKETVDNIEQRTSEATQAAKKTAGEVAVNTSKASAQAAQTAKIASALAASSEVEKTRIDVDTVDKTVYLTGTVPTAKMKNKAHEIAKTMADPGYTVVNQLVVEEQKMDDNR